MIDYNLQTVKWLKSELKTRGLESKGEKWVLVKRMTEAARGERFHHFRKLPTEVTERIWLYAMPPRRLVVCYGKRVDNTDGGTTQALRNIMHSCYQAYSLGKQFYPLDELDDAPEADRMPFFPNRKLTYRYRGTFYPRKMHKWQVAYHDDVFFVATSETLYMLMDHRDGLARFYPKTGPDGDRLIDGSKIKTLAVTSALFQRFFFNKIGGLIADMTAFKALKELVIVDIRGQDGHYKETIGTQARRNIQPRIGPCYEDPDLTPHVLSGCFLMNHFKKALEKEKEKMTTEQLQQWPEFAISVSRIMILSKRQRELALS